MRKLFWFLLILVLSDDGTARKSRRNKKHYTSPEPTVAYIDEPDIVSFKTSVVTDYRNINCEEFALYALNCTITAAMTYNSTKKSPPEPYRLPYWCAAIKHLTTCAREWNLDCKDVTNSRFNEESISGHNFVISRICEDSNFLAKYDELPYCIDSVSERWEKCYLDFGTTADNLKKNSTKEWSHFESHFYLCCAKAKFRRCTFDALFSGATNCTKDQAFTLQRFSVIISEGDVFQDCDFNMVYHSCPGGDPRPLSLRAGVVTLSNFSKVASNDAVFLTSSLPCLFYFVYLPLL
ncbi:uncharacterized protein LOC113227368 [Hyposmocoma kahamanoa]|uniref:uncharacterized protein LOC113227368 n=1 Tax=Hyposmocoma kahamanoa TaxID=1477025 RepID=UPI000E6D7A33|nr:uncharacterized protein LOC113227368 [Hyposmocoma kahamanoa]